MIVAGVDVGAATAKAVILKDEGIQGFSVIPTGYDVKLAADKVTKEALAKAGLSISIDDLSCIVSTGYGRDAVGFADKAVTEILCHARGAHFLIPSTRTIFDIGGQDSKAIGVNENGNVTDFAMNDKCAAGTGRFLEVMAEVLEVGSVDKMGPLSLESKDPCKISSTCTIFAETEVVSLRAQGRSREDLIAGVHRSVASRVAVMGSRIAWKKDVIFTGGVAKNIGVKRALEGEIGMEIIVPDEPQIIGALGAALIARERLKEG
ncbi:MAG: 2-hydroxyglutaryl-CoA dehydratase [Deltaproteobacteria bacterium]|nr:MAG: 2-hydroxyglutaryl-CoA dehydratase [Deltaproteobacteria bacterium]